MGVPALRKKAYASTFGLVRFGLVVCLIVVAVAYGWIRQNT